MSIFLVSVAPVFRDNAFVITNNPKIKSFNIQYSQTEQRICRQNANESTFTRGIQNS